MFEKKGLILLCETTVETTVTSNWEITNKTNLKMNKQKANLKLHVKKRKITTKVQRRISWKSRKQRGKEIRNSSSLEMGRISSTVTVKDCYIKVAGDLSDLFWV
ncbi:1652_t:CDS:2 [Cetraspora pellucida]|uniref:1652_t:CDS:1 n=1 Tax=Cetraspora pellucida TaxID=1433469 RepID=A0A9N8Z2Z6_9GLOM|nr:1652_t:CDS:2 [Cetraspora pellucida]